MHQMAEASRNEMRRKAMRTLCLHGWRTSGKILEKMVCSRWPASVRSELDLVFADAPFPAKGKYDVEGIFDSPYFEWFHADQAFKNFDKFEECLIIWKITSLAAALPGMQKEGVALTKHPKIKFLIIISGRKFGSCGLGLPTLAANAFSSPIRCPSIHFIGKVDFVREESEALVSSFVNPIVIYHPKGHNIPKLIGEDHEKVLDFIQNVQKGLSYTIISKI